MGRTNRYVNVLRRFRANTDKRRAPALLNLQCLAGTKAKKRAAALPLPVNENVALTVERLDSFIVK